MTNAEIIELYKMHDLPFPPEQINRGDCCESNCIPCILVTYNGELAKWLDELRASENITPELLKAAYQYIKEERKS